MAQHGGAGRWGPEIQERLDLEFWSVVRREDARLALLTPQELEEEPAREIVALARVPLILTYDNSPAPIRWNLVRQEAGDNLAPPEELEEEGEPPPLEDGPPEVLRGGSRAGA